ncbi:MAG: DNA/RNA endonuclease [Chloroflexi bacterium]|nr:DNA/RNA endonuclease [Chloroflexota bacterium]|tara:strand:- start:2309 stop:3052 length:744 start_codon:yes stop_codon:yes gene_type:complete
MKHIYTILFLFLVNGVSLPTWSEILEWDYEEFTLWLDCENRVAVRFSYQLGKDVGNQPRNNNYRLDKNPALPEECQQKTNKVYTKYTHLNETYDRGHLVPFNHMDHSTSSSDETNYMTNILPQVANMNRGAWLRTEEITECYRDHFPLQIIGGAIWDKNSQYLDRHAIRVPQYFWKIIVRGDEVIAWLIPNSKQATDARLDDYLVSVKEIEEKTNNFIVVSDAMKRQKIEKSWSREYCDKRDSNWRS